MNADYIIECTFTIYVFFYLNKFAFRYFKRLLLSCNTNAFVHDKIYRNQFQKFFSDADI